MRNRSLSAQHDAAVARRLELLTTELATVRARRPEVDDEIAFVDVPGLGHAEGIGGVGGSPTPSVARMPGRHASRRGATSGGGVWSAMLPDVVRGQLGLGPGQVAVVAVFVAVGLGLTCWWLVRGSAHDVTAPSSLATSPALATPDTVGTSGAGSTPGALVTDAAPAGTPSRVVVDVAGKVRHPGIAVLRQGARVIDAVRAAGGARPGVDLGSLNLARVLTDGEQIVVGSPGTVGGPAPASASGAPPGALIDINTADETTLESLPEVGPVTAQAILTWRTQHGGFSSVDQLLDVEGIGDATLAKLKPYVTI